MIEVSQDLWGMTLGSLDQRVLELIALLQGERQSLPDNCRFVTLESERRFISAEDPVESIWILLQGKVKAKEEYPSGDVYVFRKFRAPEVFGEMEVLADLPTFRATLVSECTCAFLVLPVSVYVDVLRNNPRYLYKRTKYLIKSVLDVQKNHRLYMRLQAADRVMLYFLQYYRIHASGGQCTLQVTRQQLADETGYSVKTVNRVIKELKESNLIRQQGHSIVIDQNQYLNLLASLDDIVAATDLPL